MVLFFLVGKETYCFSEGCGWVKFRECSELLFGRRFLLWLNAAVCKLCKASNPVQK